MFEVCSCGNVDWKLSSRLWLSHNSLSPNSKSHSNIYHYIGKLCQSYDKTVKLVPVHAVKCNYWVLLNYCKLWTLIPAKWVFLNIKPLFWPDAFPDTSRKNTWDTCVLDGPFSGTTRVSQYQKGKTNLDFTEATDSEWQWHQLGHMQVCTSLYTDNHASTPPLSFLQAGCPSCCPTNSVKALKAKNTHGIFSWKSIILPLSFWTMDFNYNSKYTTTKAISILMANVQVKVKVKFSHTRYRALGPELIPVYRQSAHRSREVNHAIDLAVGCHYFLPGLRLPP